MSEVRAKIKFYTTRHNNVRFKVKLEGKNGFSYIKGTKSHIKYNNGQDSEEYPLIIQRLNVLSSFLETNGIKYGDYEKIDIDPESIDHFYGFYTYNDHKCFGDLKQKNIDEWWNYDLPDLSRYEVNKEGYTNMLGVKRLYFARVLVEATFSNIYLDEYLTKEEARLITKGHMGTRLDRECAAFIRSASISETDVKKKERIIQEYEEKIQEVIDNHADQIIDEIKDDYLEARMTSSGEIKYVDKNFGFDCGWVNIKTRNSQYIEARELLKNYNRRCKPEERSDFGSSGVELNVRYPVTVQSTTVQKQMFKYIQKYVFEELGEELYSQTELD
ncbi:MAG: hypothetical protein ACOCQR_02370 [bacterium]